MKKDSFLFPFYLIFKNFGHNGSANNTKGEQTNGEENKQVHKKLTWFNKFPNPHSKFQINPLILLLEY